MGAAVIPTLKAERFEHDAVSSFAETIITSSASANTKGTYTQLTASSGFRASWMLLTIRRGGSNNFDFLIDIATGAAASETNIITNILFSGKATLFPINQVLIPFEIPAGTRIAARCQSSTGSGTVGVGVTLIGGEGMIGSNRSESWGFDTSKSGGIITDPGAAGSTKSGYIQIQATTAFNVRWLLICIGNQANGTETVANYFMDVAVGAAASETIIIPDLHFIVGTTTNGFPSPGLISIPCNIPAGSRVSVRLASSTTDGTDRLKEMVFVGFN